MQHDSMSEWQDLIVGARMTVDQAFTDRVQASEFTNQEWGLIMTATELDIERADDPEAARLVADTGAIESVLPELEQIRSQRGQVAGGGASDNNSGVVDSIKSALGFDDDDTVDQTKVAAAESLAQEYAEKLQQHLESNDEFEPVRRAYTDKTGS